MSEIDQRYQILSDADMETTEHRYLTQSLQKNP